MPKVKVSCFAISIDGYGAGPDQSPETPLGIGGESLHDWFVPTRSFKEMHGGTGGVTGINDDFARKGMENAGAWILGRNMFGPIRGDWPDENWKGWWGDEPPYHCDVFVLTRFPRRPQPMEGGTTFYFVTGGIHEALQRAQASAGEKDVRIGGGVSTVRQYLQAGLIDEMHLAVSPVLLGSGEHLLTGLDLRACGLDQITYTPTENAAHYVFSRSKPRES